MKKITLAEKIARAEARAEKTKTYIYVRENLIARQKQRVIDYNAKLDSALSGAHAGIILPRPSKEVVACRNDALVYAARARDTAKALHLQEQELAVLQKRLANELAYRNKLIAAHLEIERQNAEEEANIIALVNGAGAVA